MDTEWCIYLNSSNPITISIDHDLVEIPEFTAVFKDEFDIIFRNNFTSVGNQGIIKVNDVQYSSPTQEFQVTEENTIEGEAINQTYNGIYYTFDYWSDGSTNYQNRIETFEPDDHTTYTAYFEGNPLKVENFTFVCDVGDPIEFEWDEHPNSNVNYQIWMQVKPQGGPLGDPQLIGTLQHGTTTYTDDLYEKSSTYVYLLWYDVRAYYTVEQTTASEEWYSVYGRIHFKNGIVSDLSPVPEEFSITNFPNPFNPETVIQYAIPEKSLVRIEIYDISGRTIKSLVEEQTPAGVHQLKWDGRNDFGNQVSSGVYFYQIQAVPNTGSGGIYNETRKMMLLR